ncbi:MAG TPA: alpha/beta fold hydrolase [Thermoanaerobaculia bacterium]|nr:alpha/beta fold hydrolase [Thermoanaerobaculia bacterium]
MTIRSAAVAALLVVLATAAIATPHPCPPPLAKAHAKCETVTVAEDPAKSDGRTIGLNVIVIPAIKKKAGEPAMFYLEGGPGIAATNAAGFYVGPGSVYREHRDVVLVDQRGTGRSNPLHCPELEKRGPLVEMYPADEVKACREALEKTADLTQYSSERAADDVEAVRRALGYEKIDLAGLSYGTRLAQVYMKRYPSRVRRVLLAGFAPLDYRTPLSHAVNAQRVLDLIFYKCERDAACAKKYPLLRDDWSWLMQMAKLGTVPAGPFAEAVRTLMGTAASQRKLPADIHAAREGRFEQIEGRFATDSSQFALGEYFSIVCSEAAPRIRDLDVAQMTLGTFLGEYRVRQELNACANWTKYDVAPAFYDPPKSGSVLVMSGEMDATTPPDWGYEFCAKLPHCHVLLFPDLGHGPFDLDQWQHGECWDAIAAKFLASGRIDDECMKGMKPPDFQ